MPDRVFNMDLKVEKNDEGVKSVVQDPPQIDIRKADFDVVRISNADTTENISVKLAAANAGDLFSPVPPTTPVSLGPGEHVDWRIAPQLGPVRRTRFFTIPPSLHSTDHTDVHIEC